MVLVFISVWRVITLLGCKGSFSSTFRLLLTGLFWLSTPMQLLIAYEIASPWGNYIVTSKIMFSFFILRDQRKSERNWSHKHSTRNLQIGYKMQIVLNNNGEVGNWRSSILTCSRVISLARLKEIHVCLYACLCHLQQYKLDHPTFQGRKNRKKVKLL